MERRQPVEAIDETERFTRYAFAAQMDLLKKKVIQELREKGTVSATSVDFSNVEVLTYAEALDLDVPIDHPEVVSLLAHEVPGFGPQPNQNGGNHNAS